MPLLIRHAGPADVAALALLVRRSFRGEASRAGWTSEDDLLGGTRTDEAQVGAFIARPDVVMLLGEEAGIVLACCQLERRGELAELGMLAVEPARQASGFGRMLIAAAEAVALGWGARGVQLFALDRQVALGAWYDRRGYVRTGEQKPFPADERFGRPKIDGLHLERRVRMF